MNAHISESQERTRLDLLTHASLRDSILEFQVTLRANDSLQLLKALSPRIQTPLSVYVSPPQSEIMFVLGEWMNDSPLPRPRIFYGWYLVGASIAMNIYLSASFFIGLQAYFLPIIREFGWSNAATSVAYSLRQVETGFLAPVVGIIVDRWGGRSVIFWSVICSGLGLIALSQISTLWHFYLVVALISVGASGASHGVSWSTIIANWFRRMRGRALGFALLGPVFGGPLVVVVAQLVEVIGWRQTSIVLGVGFLLVGIPLSLLVKNRPSDIGLAPDGLPEESAAADANSGTDVNDYTVRGAIATSVFWCLFGVYSAQGIAVSGLLAHQMAYFEVMGFTTTAAASTVTVLFATSGIGRIGAGFLLDSISWRVVLVVVLAGQAAAFWVLISATDYWSAYLFATLEGISFGAILASRPILVGKFFGTRSFGTIQGLFQAATVGSGVVGPILFGSVYDAYGTYAPGVYAVVAITIAAMPLPLLAKVPEAKYPRLR